MLSFALKINALMVCDWPDGAEAMSIFSDSPNHQAAIDHQHHQHSPSLSLPSMLLR